MIKTKLALTNFSMCVDVRQRLLESEGTGAKLQKQLRQYIDMKIIFASYAFCYRTVWKLLLVTEKV